jgi:voltage-gated potassium channel Kch
MSTQTEDRRALFLMLSLFVFITLAPFLAGNRTGELVLIFSLSVSMVAAILELAGNPLFLRIAVPLAVLSTVSSLLYYFQPLRAITFLYFGSLVLFLGTVAVTLFAYLGRRGAITRGRIFGSVSLYFIIAFLWFGIYNLINTNFPGAFAGSAYARISDLPRGTFLYFSMVTLTTLGYGDIIPVHPVARAAASLEAVTGVLYLTITVARLVSNYQHSAED